LHHFTRKRDAYAVYLLSEGAAALFYSLIFTVSSLYQVLVVGLDPLQLVLVGTTLEVVAFCFEVPTGIVADLFSRRLSILIGFLLTGLAYIVQGLVPTFGAVLLSQVIWGLGITFTSGATQAWISDEVGEARAGQAFVRAAQVGPIGALVGIGLSVALGSVHVRLPIVIGGGLFVALAGTLALIMPETGFKPAPRTERTTLRSMGSTFREGLGLVRTRGILLTFLGIAAITGLFSEGFDRLWTPHVIENLSLPTAGGFQPVVWFGAFNVIGIFLGLGATELVRRRIDVQSDRAVGRALLTFSGVMSAALVAFALAPGFAIGMAAYFVATTLRHVSGPLEQAWLNRHVDSSVRATMFSMAGQVNAIGQIAGGPGIGLIGARVSLRAALTASGLLLAPITLLYARALRQSEEREPVPVVESAELPA
jgi:DHA3 family tetracycline resistance protein-like MFS transporter